MNSYFAYTRVSTVRQGERGSSLQEQRSAIEAYAARNDLQIGAWFEEMETAAKQGRRVFNKMLGELKKGRAAGVIIHKIDRSARNLRDWAQLGELIDSGVAVHFAHESVDLLSRGGRLSADIQAVVAADYIRNLREEVKKGFYGRLKQGLFPLGAPTGYLNEGGGKPKSIDPVKGPLVRKMFELYDTGRYSIHDLRAEMYSRGLAAHQGQQLSKSMVSRILHNPFYMGLIYIGKTGQSFQGVHEPIVRAALFARVQARLAGRTVAPVVKHEFVYRRLIKCVACKRSLCGERHKGHTYYRCHTRTCRYVSLREEEITAAVTAVLTSITLTEEDMRDFRDLAATLRGAEALAAENQVTALRRDLGRCEDRLARLTDLLVDRNIDQETFEERKSALLHERASIRDRLNAPSGASPLDELQKKFELGNMAQLRFETPNDAERRETIEFVCSNFSVDGKNLTITPRFPFSELIKTISVHGGPPNDTTLRKRRSRLTQCRNVRTILLRLAREAITTDADVAQLDRDPTLELS
jgi:DNA invertase Pin-like site-specific DNA recombinase